MNGDLSTNGAVFSDVNPRSFFPNLLSEFVYTRTYSRWVPELGRREVWPETVARFLQFISEERDLPPEILEGVKRNILTMNVMPSMRALWAAGPAARRDNTCLYNCSSLPIDSFKSFSEALYILMQGTGVGFSVEKQFVSKLPVVAQDSGVKLTYRIEDSTEGWADALYFGVKSWFEGHTVDFDYSGIRPAGAPLIIKGGRASGPDPLRQLMEFAELTIRNAKGRKLRTIECHDIMCYIAEIVQVGGYRRASLISISDPDDSDMRGAKDWSQGKFPEIRYMANNSAYYAERPSEVAFWDEWDALAKSGSGERGFVIDNWHKRAPRPQGKIRTNPCVTGDTQVLTPNGLVRIKDFVGLQMPLVIDPRFNKGTESVTTDSGAIFSGYKEVFQLETSLGFQLKATADHKVMTTKGWVPVGNFEGGEKIHVLHNGDWCTDVCVGIATSCGVEEVFDLQEPLTNSFVANGIVVHNCGEIGLRFEDSQDPVTGLGGAGSFCNLSAAVMRSYDTVDSMAEKVRLATWIGALQASFTHFPYLRPGWQEICNEDRLLGVDITGQCDNPALSNNSAVMTQLNKVALQAASDASRWFSINMPAAVTCGKPSGNCRPWNGLTTTTTGLYTMYDLFSDHPEGAQWVETHKGLEVLRGDGAHQKILRTYDNGVAPVLRITMNYGLVVESTPDHKWYVSYRLKNGGQDVVGAWVPAKDISPKDVLDIKLGLYNKTTHSPLVALHSRAWRMRLDIEESIQYPSELNEDVCWLLGYLWGDGCQSPQGYRFRFTDGVLENIEKARRILQEQFGLVSELRQPKGRNVFVLEVASVALWHWLIRNGVFKYFADKIDLIPTVIRESAQADVLAFMAGLLDSDGWVGRKRSGGKWSLTYTTSSGLFAQHLQDVAWAVGVGLGRSLNAIGRSYQKVRSMFLLGCSVHVQAIAFEALRRNSTKIQRAEKEAGFTGWEWENRPSGIRTNHPGRVISVESIGDLPTFDLEVSGDHWYYAGAVKTHNSSQFLNCASGFHPRYAPYYMRRVRISAVDPLCRLARDHGFPMYPDNGQETWPEKRVTKWVVEFPVASPQGSMTRHDESAIEQCNRYLHIMKSWCGDRGHNQSATIYVRDNEWDIVGKWVWDNFDTVTGLSFLPYAGGNYRLAPYEEITETQYKDAAARTPDLDFSLLSEYEREDLGGGSQELACVGGVCEL